MKMKIDTFISICMSFRKTNTRNLRQNKYFGALHLLAGLQEQIIFKDAFLKKKNAETVDISVVVTGDPTCAF